MPKNAGRPGVKESYQRRLKDGFAPMLRLLPYGYARSQDGKSLVEVPGEMERVRKILSSGDSNGALAKEHGLTRMMVWRIRNVYRDLYESGILVRGGVELPVTIIKPEKKEK